MRKIFEFLDRLFMKYMKISGILIAIFFIALLDEGKLWNILKGWNWGLIGPIWFAGFMILLIPSIMITGFGIPKKKSKKLKGGE